MTTLERGAAPANEAAAALRGTARGALAASIAAAVVAAAIVRTGARADDGRPPPPPPATAAAAPSLDARALDAAVRALAGADPRARAAALDALERAERRGAEALARALAGADRGVRIAALDGLAALGRAAEDALLPLARHALAAADGDERRLAVEAVRAIADDGGSPPDASGARALAEAIASALADDEASVRTSAARALGALDAPADVTLPPLALALADEDARVRLASAEAAGLLALAAAEDRPPRSARRSARAGLRSPGRAAGGAPGAGGPDEAGGHEASDVAADEPLAEDELGVLLDDGSRLDAFLAFRASALAAAAPSPGSAAASPAAAAPPPPPPPPPLPALVAEARLALAEALGDRDPRVRVAALVALGHVATAAERIAERGDGGPPAAPTAEVAGLAALLGDPDAALRSDAAYALGRLDRAASAAAPALIERVAEDPELGVRLAAVHALARVAAEDPDARAAAVTAATRLPHPALRGEAYRALSGEVAALPPVALAQLERDLDAPAAADAAWDLLAQQGPEALGRGLDRILARVAASGPLPAREREREPEPEPERERTAAPGRPGEVEPSGLGDELDDDHARVDIDPALQLALRLIDRLPAPTIAAPDLAGRLRSLLDAEHPAALRAAAARALGGGGATAVAGALERWPALLDGPHALPTVDARVEALFALAVVEQGPPEAVLSQHPDGPAAARAILLAALDAADPRMRRAAAELLVSGSAAAAAALRERARAALARAATAPADPAALALAGAIFDAAIDRAPDELARLLELADELGSPAAQALAAGARRRTGQTVDTARLFELLALLEEPDPALPGLAIAALSDPSLATPRELPILTRLLDASLGGGAEPGPALLEPTAPLEPSAPAEPSASAEPSAPAAPAGPSSAAALQSSPARFALARLGALGRSARPAAPHIAAALATAPDAERRVLAAQALGAIGEPAAEGTLAALRAGLADPAPEVRRACAIAARALSRGSRRALAPALASALADIDPWTRLAAARALEPLPADAVARLAGLLDHPDPVLLREAREEIGRRARALPAAALAGPRGDAWREAGAPALRAALRRILEADAVADPGQWRRIGAVPHGLLDDPALLGPLLRVADPDALASLLTGRPERVGEAIALAFADRPRVGVLAAAFERLDLPPLGPGAAAAGAGRAGPPPARVAARSILALWAAVAERDATAAAGLTALAHLARRGRGGLVTIAALALPTASGPPLPSTKALLAWAPGAAPALVRLLDDRDPHLRGAAAAALAEVAYDHDLGPLEPALVAALAREPAPFARGALLATLLRREDRLSAPAAAALRARLALPRLDPAEVEAIADRVPLWSPERWPAGRERALDAIARGAPAPAARLRALLLRTRLWGEARTATGLLVGALDDPSREVRFAALHALGRIGTDVDLARCALTGRLVAIAGEPDRGLAVAAVRALAALPADPRTPADALEPWLAHDEAGPAARAALARLGARAAPVVSRALLAGERDGTDGGRSALLEALATRGSLAGWAAPIVAEAAAAAPAPEVRAAALGALVRVDSAAGSRVSVAALARAIEHDPDISVRVRACRLLVHIPAARHARPALRAALARARDDPARELREAAAHPFLVAETRPTVAALRAIAVLLPDALASGDDAYLAWLLRPLGALRATAFFARRLERAETLSEVRRVLVGLDEVPGGLARAVAVQAHQDARPPLRALAGRRLATALAQAAGPGLDHGLLQEPLARAAGAVEPAAWWSLARGIRGGLDARTLDAIRPALEAALVSAWPDLANPGLHAAALAKLGARSEAAQRIIREAARVWPLASPTARPVEGASPEAREALALALADQAPDLAVEEARALVGAEPSPARAAAALAPLLASSEEAIADLATRRLTDLLETEPAAARLLRAWKRAEGLAPRVLAAAARRARREAEASVGAALDGALPDALVHAGWTNDVGRFARLARLATLLGERGAAEPVLAALAALAADPRAPAEVRGEAALALVVLAPEGEGGRVGARHLANALDHVRRRADGESDELTAAVDLDRIAEALASHPSPARAAADATWRALRVAAPPYSAATLAAALVAGAPDSSAVEDALRDLLAAHRRGVADALGAVASEPRSARALTFSIYGIGFSPASGIHAAAKRRPDLFVGGALRDVAHGLRWPPRDTADAFYEALAGTCAALGPRAAPCARELAEAILGLAKRPPRADCARALVAIGPGAVPALLAVRPRAYDPAALRAIARALHEVRRRPLDLWR